MNQLAKVKRPKYHDDFGDYDLSIIDAFGDKIRPLKHWINNPAITKDLQKGVERFQAKLKNPADADRLAWEFSKVKLKPHEAAFIVIRRLSNAVFWEKIDNEERWIAKNPPFTISKKLRGLSTVISDVKTFGDFVSLHIYRFGWESPNLYELKERFQATTAPLHSLLDNINWLAEQLPKDNDLKKNYIDSDASREDIKVQ